MKKKIVKQKEDLLFLHMGNGVTVCDKNREKHNDYLTVAHFGYNRSVQYHTDELSDGARQEIEALADKGNMAVSVTRPDTFALCPLEITQTCNV